MLNLSEFGDVFGAVGKNHYPTHLVSQVQAAQEELPEKLFFYQLLDILQIKDGESSNWLVELSN